MLTRLHTLLTCLQNVSNHVNSTCLCVFVRRWRGWWWIDRREGCQASDHSLSLSFKFVNISFWDIFNETSIFSCGCGDIKLIFLKGSQDMSNCVCVDTTVLYLC